MVRKERALTDQRLVGVESGEFQELVEGWLQKVRVRLPEGGTAVATVHKLPRRRYLVSFRASAFGETFISEVREESLVKGIEKAGTRLLERLEQSPPKEKAKFGEKVRRLFGEAEAS